MTIITKFLPLGYYLLHLELVLTSNSASAGIAA